MALNTTSQKAAERAKLKIQECETEILLARDKLEIVKFLDKVIESLKQSRDIYVQIVESSKNNVGWRMMIDANQKGAEISTKTWRNRDQVNENLVALAAELGLVLDDRAVYGNMLIYRAYLSKK